MAKTFPREARSNQGLPPPYRRIMHLILKAVATMPEFCVQKLGTCKIRLKLVYDYIIHRSTYINVRVLLVKQLSDVIYG